MSLAPCAVRMRSPSPGSKSMVSPNVPATIRPPSGIVATAVVASLSPAPRVTRFDVSRRRDSSGSSTDRAERYAICWQSAVDDRQFPLRVISACPSLRCEDVAGSISPDRGKRETAQQELPEISMSDKPQRLKRLTDCGVIAIIRTDSAEKARNIAMAAVDGDVVGVEVTLTTPGALDVMRALHEKLGDRAIIGAGTVLNARQAQDVLEAGATFIVSPAYDPQVLQLSLRSGAISIPGAFTPAEILGVSRAGADLIKVFPSTSVGPTYFRDLLRPLPHLKLIATGGVTLNDAAEWIRSGSVLVGVGGDLVRDNAA